MKKNYIIINFIILFVIAIQFTSCTNEKVISPPKAPEKTHIEILNGDTRSDNYFWMRENSNLHVQEYINAENEYTDAVMSHTLSLQNKLFEEFSSRMGKSIYTAPMKFGEYYYYQRNNQGEQYSAFCRKKKSLDAREEIILDENQLARKHKYYKVGAFEISPDQRFMAYCVDTTGSESYTIYIKDLHKNTLLKDVIPNCANTFKWANDNQTLFYCTIDITKRANRVFRHKTGSDLKSDDFIYYEKDNSFNIQLFKSKTNNYIFIGLGNLTTTEFYFLDAANPQISLRLVHPREQNLQYYIYDGGSKFYIYTNDNAVNFRIMEAPVNNPSKSNWKEVVPHRNNVKIDNVETFRNYLVLFERESGLTKIEIVNLTNKSVKNVSFNESSYCVNWSDGINGTVSYNQDYETNLLRYIYSSLSTPTCLYEYDMDLNKSTMIRQLEASENYYATAYEIERVFARTNDGVMIPISLVHKKGLERNGNNPLLLFGYGAYGVANESKFSTEIISLLDRGFIYAIPHIRGGGELGDTWYAQGKLLKKKNTFTDFIACAEYLIREKYTSKEKLVISGRSAGGMVIGTVINMRPDLFKIAVANVPFVDVLNTMLDASLPLTVNEYDEWGNPNNKIYYDYIKSYSPYDNIKAQNYPELLVTASLNDPRVGYWEPLKWTARLRQMKTDKNQVLLRMYKNSGHKGTARLNDNLRATAFEYAFILDRLGMGT